MNYMKCTQCSKVTEPKRVPGGPDFCPECRSVDCFKDVCEKCDGDGYVEIGDVSHDGLCLVAEARTCDECEGTGEVA